MSVTSVQHLRAERMRLCPAASYHEYLDALPFLVGTCLIEMIQDSIIERLTV